MKRLTSLSQRLLLLLIALACFSACGGDSATPADGATPQAPDAPSTSIDAGGGAETGGAAAGGTSGNPDVAVAADAGADVTDTAAGETAPPALALQLGDWAGNTSQGQVVSFTVAADGIKKLFFGYTGTSCRGGQAVFHLEGKPIAPIKDNKFRVIENLSGTSAGYFNLAGEFASRSSASGTVTFDIVPLAPGGCAAKGTATWTASAGADAAATCTLSDCKGTPDIAFYYSCGTPNSSMSSMSGGGRTTLKVTYSNNHVVDCVATADGHGMCKDDSGASCAW